MKLVFFAISLLVVLACASADKSFVLNGESPLTFEVDVNSIIETLPNRKKTAVLNYPTIYPNGFSRKPISFFRES